LDGGSGRSRPLPTHRKKHRDTHVSNGILTHDPSVLAGEDSAATMIGICDLTILLLTEELRVRTLLLVSIFWGNNVFIAERPQVEHE
jgi:hypothetical protein